MRRIISVLAVVALMAAMLAAMAAPAFAQGAEHVSVPGTAGGAPCEAKGVITPSDNTNLRCQVKPAGDNSGGSDGGGATVAKGPVVVLNAEGEEVVTPKGHFVGTPSGNRTIHGHYNPDNT